MGARVKGDTIMAENVKRALEYKAKHKCLVCGTKDETEIANQELLELKCDVLVPAAIGNQIIEKNDPRIKAKIIAKGANGATTPDRSLILEEVRGRPDTHR
jgi:glutamate dehydrogenase/leucine dehydrogenase